MSHGLRVLARIIAQLTSMIRAWHDFGPVTARPDIAQPGQGTRLLTTVQANTTVHLTCGSVAQLALDKLRNLLPRLRGILLASDQGIIAHASAQLCLVNLFIILVRVEEAWQHFFLDR